MTNEQAEILLQKIQIVFSPYLEKIATLDVELSFRAGHSQNESFPLKVYFSFMNPKYPDDDSLDIVIDVWQDKLSTKIDVDVCWESGKLIFPGPSMTFSSSGNIVAREENFKTWLEKFSKFLDAIWGSLKVELLNMGDIQDKAKPESGPRSG